MTFVASNQTLVGTKRPQTSPRPSLSGLQRRTLRSPTVLIPHITPRAVVCTPTVIVARSAVVTIAGAMGGDAGHYSTRRQPSDAGQAELSVLRTYDILGVVLDILFWRTARCKPML